MSYTILLNLNTFVTQKVKYFLERKCFSKENNFSLKVAPTKSWYWVCFWLNKILYCKYGLAYLCIDSHSVHSCKSSTIVVIIFVVIMSHRFSRCAGCCHYFTPWSYTQLLSSWTGYGTAKDAVGGSIWLWLEVVMVVQCSPFRQGQTQSWFVHSWQCTEKEFKNYCKEIHPWLTNFIAKPHHILRLDLEWFILHTSHATLK